ncbi:MAG: DUF3592 domain-containing protein [Luteolibacter sp.]
MKGSTIFLVLLGLSISAIGGLFTVLMWNSYARAVDQRSWPQVEAVILSSEVEEWKHDEFSPREYRFKVLYGYEWKGAAMTGDQLSARGNPSYNKRQKPDNMLEQWPVGTKTIIYVNQEDPNNTILKPDSKAAGYSIWFPMLFVIGGLGISLRAVIKRPVQVAD